MYNEKHPNHVYTTAFYSYHTLSYVCQIKIMLPSIMNIHYLWGDNKPGLILGAMEVSYEWDHQHKKTSRMGWVVGLSIMNELNLLS